MQAKSKALTCALLSKDSQTRQPWNATVSLQPCVAAACAALCAYLIKIPRSSVPHQFAQAAQRSNNSSDCLYRYCPGLLEIKRTILTMLRRLALQPQRSLINATAPGPASFSGRCTPVYHRTPSSTRQQPSRLCKRPSSTIADRPLSPEGEDSEGEPEPDSGAAAAAAFCQYRPLDAGLYVVGTPIGEWSMCGSERVFMRAALVTSGHAWRCDGCYRGDC